MRTLFFCLLLAFSTFSRAEVIDIGNAELKQLMSKGVSIIDIRTQAEWEETGIITGSRLLTFFDERGRANPGEWLGKAKSIARPEEPVIVICRSGNRTQAVSQFLSQQAGYAKVYNVKHGLKGWFRENGPVVPAQQAIAACQAAKTC